MSGKRTNSLPRLCPPKHSAVVVYLVFQMDGDGQPLVPFEQKPMEVDMFETLQFEISRRSLLMSSAAQIALVAVTTEKAEAQTSKEKMAYTSEVSLTVNGESHEIIVDNRTTLLDALREHLHFTGTKKGCDHGQCGACTVTVNGRRINSCLSLTLMHEGDEVITIEGLGKPGDLHPVQAAFVKHDGFQCGYCTPGQICSSIAVLQEIEANVPSHVTRDLTEKVSVTPEEIRERMSGNICRCGAYSNILDAIVETAGIRQ
jgi:xanthine dehydrogenase YagT iron-sulfur-binding subunit